MQITQSILPKEDNIVKHTRMKDLKPKQLPPKLRSMSLFIPQPELIRSVNVVGYVKHGKPGLVSLLHHKKKESEEK